VCVCVSVCGHDEVERGENAGSRQVFVCLSASLLPLSLSCCLSLSRALRVRVCARMSVRE